MKRLALGLAFGALLAAAPFGAASAAPVDTVLTPAQAGITEPAQGFNPYFTGLGGGPYNGAGFWGNSTVSGIGVTSMVPQQGLVGTTGFAIFGTGHPMLTSTISAPMRSTICAASAIFTGSPPKI